LAHAPAFAGQAFFGNPRFRKDMLFRDMRLVRGLALSIWFSDLPVRSRGLDVSLTGMRIVGAAATGHAMETKARDELALAFGRIVSEAGNLIRSLQPGDMKKTEPGRADLGIRRKPDGSPVCRADLEAEALILSRLAAILPGVKVVAEESFASARHSVPERFLLVDPLDGTREFLAGHADFTVNIALIEAGEPVAGAICAPARHQVYVGGVAPFAADLGPDGVLFPTALRPIATRATAGSGLSAVVSRSHLDRETQAWLRRDDIAEVARTGSSLKFCLIARGEADVYPRLAPTMEWDTAAGHAILNAAGGCVLTFDGSPLRYGKQDLGFKNGGFIAWGRRPDKG
jgi:3'(2'), 5'-bisphosphate nucleotidase